MASSSGGTASTSSQVGTQGSTFAAITKENATSPPKSPFNKTDGIIMHAVDGIEAEEYVYAIGIIIGPQNLTNYSKISNGRIRIYLKSKSLVEQITTTYKTLKINNIDVQIRPLQMRSTRIIIANASPEIPHALIEQALMKLGLKPTSAMIFLRAGLKKPGYEHILSSRRCVYIASDFIYLPETTTVLYEESEHRIFLADDSAFCTVKNTAIFSKTANLKKETNYKTTQQVTVIIAKLLKVDKKINTNHHLKNI